MEDVKTYLEFGYKKGKEKFTYDEREGQDAYDFFMIARYLKDIVGYRTNNLKLVHHEQDLQDNIKKYVGLVVSGGEIFYEIGSSLMGVIDALEYIDKKHKKLDVKSVLFLGVDNSDMMNYGAKYIYPNYKLELHTNIVKKDCDVFFAKGISLLYAFKDEEEFCDVLKKAKIAIFDYTFAEGEKATETMVSGKSGTYLSFEKCKKLLDIEGKKLVLGDSTRYYADKGRKTYEVVYGDTEIVDKYLKEIKDYLK